MSGKASRARLGQKLMVGALQASFLAPLLAQPLPDAPSISSTPPAISVRHARALPARERYSVNLALLAGYSCFSWYLKKRTRGSNVPWAWRVVTGTFVSAHALGAAANWNCW